MAVTLNRYISRFHNSCIHKGTAGVLSTQFVFDIGDSSIVEYISDSEFNVEDLAKAVGVSRVQLHRKLKSLTEDTFSDFIRNIRLKQAATLLKEKKVNVSQVAYLAGFTNPTMFSIAFKK